MPVPSDRDRKPGPGLYCFCYHDVSPVRRDAHSNMKIWTSVDHFQKQMEYLSGQFEVIRPEDLKMLAGQEITGRYAMVTFDDGFKGVLQHALPIMQSIGICGIVFSSQGLLSGGSPLWPMVLRYVEHHDMQEALFRYLYNAGLIRAPVSGKLRKWIHAHYNFELQFGVEQFALAHLPDISSDLFLNTDDFFALMQAGWQVGNHGYHHSRMSRLSGRNQQYELRLSMETARYQNITINGGWAHPFGKRADANRATLRAVRAHMGRCPVFFCDGLVNRRLQINAVHRIGIGDDSVGRFREKILNADG